MGRHRIYFGSYVPPAPPSARIRYVNTASSAGGDGTTNATSGANRAYVSLKDALSAEAADLVAANVYLEIHCEGSAADTSAGGGPHYNITGFTTSADCYVHIVVDQGVRHDGKWNTGKYRVQSGYDTIHVNNSNVIIEGLQVLAGYNADDNSHRAIRIDDAVTNVTVRECIVRFDLASNGSFGNNCTGITCDVDGTGGHFFVNNLVYDFSKSGGIGIVHTSSTNPIAVYHNTVAYCTTGISDTYSDFRAINNLVTDCTTAFTASFHGDSNYNVTDAATAPGANSKTSQTITYVDEGNDDFHTSDTDCQVANNLYADATFPVLIDIDGDDRPSSGDVYAGGDEHVSSTSDAVGDAAGTSTVTAVGASTAAADGSATGTSTVTAVGASAAAAVGASDGTSTVSGVGAATFAAAGSSDGTSTAAAVGASTAASVGAADGTSTASATGTSEAAAAGSSAGTSTCSGVGASTAAAVGSSDGTSTATGAGTSLISAEGSSSGTSTAAGVGEELRAGAGASDGTSTAAAVGASTATTVGSATGTSTVSAVGASTVTAAGSSDGTCTVAATGISTAASPGLSDGTSTASGVGASTAEAVGSAAGSSTATAEGTVVGEDEGAGTSTGTSTAIGVGASTATAAGVSDGTSTVAAVGASRTDAAGAASGVATALGVGAAATEGAGSSTGVGQASAPGAALSAATGSATGTSNVTAEGTGIKPGDGSAAGTSTCAATGEATTSSEGSSAGVATGTGTGTSAATAAGSSTGTSTATGVGSFTKKASSPSVVERAPALTIERDADGISNVLAPPLLGVVDSQANPTRLAPIVAAVGRPPTGRGSAAGSSTAAAYSA